MSAFLAQTDSTPTDRLAMLRARNDNDLPRMKPRRCAVRLPEVKSLP